MNIIDTIDGTHDDEEHRDDQARWAPDAEQHASESRAHIEAAVRALRALSEGYGVSPDFQHIYAGHPVRRRSSVSYQVTDEIHQFTDLTPRPVQPQGDALLRPAIEPQTMQLIVEAAASHPQFTASSRPTVSISFAPAGTDPRNHEAWTDVTAHFQRVRRGGRTAAMQAAADDGARCAEHVHLASAEDGNRCLTGECAP